MLPDLIFLQSENIRKGEKKYEKRRFSMAGIFIAVSAVMPINSFAAAGIYTNNWLPNPGVIISSSDKENTWQNSFTC